MDVVNLFRFSFLKLFLTCVLLASVLVIDVARAKPNPSPDGICTEQGLVDESSGVSLICVRVASNKMSWRLNKIASSTKTNCATGGRCVLGDIGPGGGPIIYVASNPDVFTSIGSICATSCRYLEAAPVSWSVRIQKPAQIACVKPGSSTSDPKCVWSGVTRKLIGATAQGTAIGTGFANTSAIIGQSSTVGMAATAARDFKGGGFEDWFLPSQLELNQLCLFARNLELDTGTTQCWLGELRAGFSPDYYWSSSESVGPFPARFQSFNTGAQITSSKFYAFRVRPVRAFGPAR